MIRLRMKKFNMMLIQKLQKFQPYHQGKLINTNILQMKKYYILKNVEGQNKLNVKEKLGKAFEKQTKTIEDLEEKPIKAVEDNKRQLSNANAHSHENKLLHLGKYLRLFTTEE